MRLKVRTPEMDATLADITRHRSCDGATTVRETGPAIETAAIWKGRKSVFGGDRASTLTIGTGRHGADRQLSYVLAEITNDRTSDTDCVSQNVFHAGDGNVHIRSSLYNANDPSQSNGAAESARGDEHTQALRWWNTWLDAARCRIEAATPTCFCQLRSMPICPPDSARRCPIRAGRPPRPRCSPQDLDVSARVTGAAG